MWCAQTFLLLRCTDDGPCDSGEVVWLRSVCGADVGEPADVAGEVTVDGASGVAVDAAVDGDAGEAAGASFVAVTAETAQGTDEEGTVCRHGSQQERGEGERR
jgi:hypothetical protein